MTANELKSWREKVGLTRAELGAKLKVSARTIEAWEQPARARAIPEREAERLQDLMRQDMLKIPTSPEFMAKLERMAKERGVDPVQWAADLLKAALMAGMVAFEATRIPPS
ncbi:MAG: XRE family transcriptional regulator [Verrucomicrobiaceae bacterium]|nr:MAG: XRE family transcriptional regulator [Verrucomicrobiaceae bacterium]